MALRAALGFVAGLRLFWRSGRVGPYRSEFAIAERVSHYYHFVQVVDGALAYRVGESGERELAPGASLLVPPGLRHGLRPARAATALRWADLRVLADGVIDLAELMETPLLPDAAATASIAAHVDELLALLAAPRPSLPELHRAQAALIQDLLGLATWRRGASERLPATERLLPLLHAMAADPAQPWQRSRLEALSGLRRTALTRCFRRATGCSPGRWLDRLRMERAAELLLTTDAPLADIAAQVGCCDAFHLSRRFKRANGIPPKAYRERFRLPG